MCFHVAVRVTRGLDTVPLPRGLTVVCSGPGLPLRDSIPGQARIFLTAPERWCPGPRGALVGRGPLCVCGEVPLQDWLRGLLRGVGAISDLREGRVACEAPGR